MTPKRYIVVADPHVKVVPAAGKKKAYIGGVDLQLNNALVSYMEAEGPWDGYINLGDNYDLNVISDHNKGKLKLVEGERLMDDYQAGNALLWQHYIAMKRPPRFVLLEGNHEFRVERYINANPEMDGFVNIAKHLPDFVEWIPYWSKHKILTIGDANFIHGIATGSRQTMAALKDYGKNTFQGHSHRRELLSMRYHGDDGTKVSESLPCLCEYSQPYLNGRPTAWQQGFAVFYFWPNGKFNYYVISAFDKSFIAPSGKFYNGRKMKPVTKLEI